MATTTERGYGAAHKALRKQWASKVSRGEAFCARCGRWIDPRGPWDLGHDPFDRSVYIGALHQRCNRDTRLEKSLRRPRAFRRRAEEWL